MTDGVRESADDGGSVGGRGGSRVRRYARSAASYLAIVIVTFALLDVVLIVTGLFPPWYDYGVPGLGWVAAPPTGEMSEGVCTEFSRGERYTFSRNEDGYRTATSAADLVGPGDAFEIGVTGDSHTDLCAPNEQTHFGVTERELTAAGIPSVAFGYGAGRYSPLQAYLAIRPGLERYAADALILNLYTGNDFYDILRVDDRPSFRATDDGYEIVDPVWYIYDPPGLVRRSRVLFALRQLGDATGIRGMLLRVRYLRAAAKEQGQGIGSVVAYMNDLRRSTSDDVGYSGAFAAQILNQQFFFHRFPGSSAESMNRVAELLRMIRREHPDLLLVMSPIPSYQVVGERPVDPALLDVLERLPMSHDEGVAQEEQLYRELERASREAGWVFVDNLSALRAYSGSERLYNDFDYHVEPVASEIIGRNQAEAIASRMEEPTGQAVPGRLPN